MGYRGRSVVTTGYSCKNRATSVPGFDDIGLSFEPAMHSHHVHTTAAPRTRHEHLDLSSARQPDSKFYNDVNARLAALGPEPVLTTNPYHAASYSSAAPILTNISSYHAPIIHRSHPEAIMKRHSTFTTAAVPRRSDFDAEVAAYLSYTPQTHHSHRPSSLRSSSLPPLRHALLSSPPSLTSSYAPFHTPLLTNYNSKSRSSHSTPSYINQFQHAPASSSYDWTSPLATSTHHSHHSTALPPPSFEVSIHTPAHQNTRSVRRTIAELPPSRHHDISSNFSSHQDYQYDPAAAAAAMMPPRAEARSMTKFPKSSRSVMDTYCPPTSSYRASSVDAPRPMANFKSVKPRMSDTRRKVRELICKTRNDPNYYE